jgi:hypothetical protein
MDTVTSLRVASRVSGVGSVKLSLCALEENAGVFVVVTAAVCCVSGHNAWGSNL